MAQNGQQVKRDRTIYHNGKRVRRLRLAAGLNMRQLAQKAGLSVGTISNVENHVYPAEADTLARIAEALGVDPAELVRGGRAA